MGVGCPDALISQLLKNPTYKTQRKLPSIDQYCDHAPPFPPPAKLYLRNNPHFLICKPRQIIRVRGMRLFFMIKVCQVNYFHKISMNEV